KRLWICPPWEKITPKKSEKILLLNPGLAFGTGTHPTTELCLEWLDSHIKSQQIVVDYGCGSGILALAALKLGAKLVYAVDHDKQALEATKNNATLNHIKNKQRFSLNKSRWGILRGRTAILPLNCSILNLLQIEQHNIRKQFPLQRELLKNKLKVCLP